MGEEFYFLVLNQLFERKTKAFGRILVV